MNKKFLYSNHYAKVSINKLGGKTKMVKANDKDKQPVNLKATMNDTKMRISNDGKWFITTIIKPVTYLRKILEGSQ